MKRTCLTRINLREKVRGFGGNMCYATFLVLWTFAICAFGVVDGTLFVTKCCQKGYALNGSNWECIQREMNNTEVYAVENATNYSNTSADVPGTTENISDDRISLKNNISETSKNRSRLTGEINTSEWSSKDINCVNNSCSIEVKLSDLVLQNSEDIFWLPNSFYDETQENFESLFVKFNYLPFLNCTRNSGLRFNADETKRYTLLNNGTILLLSPTTSGRLSNLSFAPSEYCVDNVNGTEDIVLQMCPCKHLHCVSKCCGKDEIYACDNQANHCKCTERGGLNWDPFAEDASKINHEISYEILGDNEPQCEDDEERRSFFAIYPYHNSPYWVAYPRGRSYKENRVCADTLFKEDDPNPRLYMKVCLHTSTFNFPSSQELLFLPAIPAAILLAIALAVSAASRQPGLSPFGWAHSSAMLCHAAALLVFNASRLSKIYVAKGDFCQKLPFLTHYALVAAAFWLNVICINMAWGFGRRSRNTAWKRYTIFLWYSLYAWGCSALWTGVTAFMWFSPYISANLMRPSLVETRTCFSEFFNSPGKLSTLVYYYGPMLGLLAFNILLYIYTICKVQKMKRHTSIVYERKNSNHNSSASRKSVLLYVKMLSLMGVGEITLETIAWSMSYSFKFEYYFAVLSAFIDLLRAVSIFALCCCTRRNMNKLLVILRNVWKLILQWVPWCRRMDCTEYELSRKNNSSSTNTASTNCETEIK